MAPITDSIPLECDNYVPSRTPECYDAFAWFYDKYWGSDIVEDFATVVNRIFVPRIKQNSSVLDLCCGTGRLAAKLLDQGFAVSGLDASHEMLEYARRNAPGAELFQADARSFSVGTRFDGVVSTFDSLNHILSLKDLTAVFRHVAASMKPQGIFLFDMNLERGFRIHWQEEFSMVRDDAVCVLAGAYDKASGLGRYVFTVFRLLDGIWQRSDFTICERPYKRNQIERALSQAGFADTIVFDAKTDLGLSDHDGRLFFLATKS